RARPRLLARSLPPAVPSLEPLDPAARVHELLLARVEGMTGRADLDVDLRLGRPGHERAPAGTPDRRRHIFRMDSRLHLVPSNLPIFPSREPVVSGDGRLLTPALGPE